MSSFFARNKPDWDELETLLNKSKKMIRKMTPEELSRMDVLYRRTTIHLSQVKTRTEDVRLIEYLTNLVASAHSLIYIHPKKKTTIADDLRRLPESFARVIARNWKFHLIAFTLFFAGGLISYFAALHNPIAAYALSMPGDPRQPGATKEQLLEVLRSGREQGSGEKFAFASVLFSHNFKVSLLAMSTGILASIPTTILMVYNGLLIGAFVSVHYQAGLQTEMWAWILPHGITEFGAIILCGGVGFMLGSAVVNPGLIKRSEKIRQTGIEGGKTCIGVAIMLIAAAIIESYLRQSHLSTSSRLTFAAFSAIFWAVFIWYGFLCEKRDSTAKEEVLIKEDSRIATR